MIFKVIMLHVKLINDVNMLVKTGIQKGFWIDGLHEKGYLLIIVD